MGNIRQPYSIQAQWCEKGKCGALEAVPVALSKQDTWCHLTVAPELSLDLRSSTWAKEELSSTGDHFGTKALKSRIPPGRSQSKPTVLRKRAA